MIGLSTYARLFIGFSSELSNFVVESARKVSTKQTAILPITILSEEQVSQSLADPQNQSLKTMIGTTYTDSLKASRLMIKGENSVINQQQIITDQLTLLAETRRTAPTQDKATIDTAMTALSNQFKQLNNIKNAFEHNRKQFGALQEDFDQLLETHYAEWTQYRAENLSGLQENLNKVLHDSGLPDLPQGEINNLLRQDAWQEVLDRFYDTGASKELPAAELERILGLENPSVETYFKLKAYLAVRSVNPSRENMGQFLKRLEGTFNQAKQQGEALTQKQNAQIKAVDENKVQPIAKVIDSNTVTLAKLDNSRAEIINSIAPIQKKLAIGEQSKPPEPSFQI